MPFDEPDYKDSPSDCPHCGGYGLRSEYRTLPDGREVIATLPCFCEAGKRQPNVTRTEPMTKPMGEAQNG